MGMEGAPGRLLPRKGFHKALLMQMRVVDQERKMELNNTALKKPDCDIFSVYIIRGPLQQKHFLTDEATYSNINYRYSLDFYSPFPTI
jgi:hypothetical protein